MSARLFPRLALCLWLCLAWTAPLAAAAGDDPLPSWRGPVKARLLAYVQAVTAQGGPDYIPPAERIAAFDLDGTLVVERPLPFVMEVSVAWLRDNCPGFAGRGPRQAALCRAAAQGDRKALRQDIENLLALPFAGWELDAYRRHAGRFFRTHPNPLKKRPLAELIYAPQRELIALLQQKGFAVWLCSGSAITAMQAISAEHLGVPPERCIGTRYGVEVARGEQGLSFRRGEVVPGLVNLGKVKAQNLKLATVHGPVLAFGNSEGDAWMLSFAAGSPRRSLALVLDHDDPREFVYSRPGLLRTARRQGWVVVSMKRDWQRVFAGR
jgi:phosphoserine phosphatase